jgi:hypothetical protein
VADNTWEPEENIPAPELIQQYQESACIKTLRIRWIDMTSTTNSPDLPARSLARPPSPPSSPSSYHSIEHDGALVELANQVENLQLGDPVGDHPRMNPSSPAQTSGTQTYHSLQSFTSLLGDTLAAATAEPVGRRLYLNALCSPTGTQFFYPHSLSHTLNRCLTHGDVWYPAPELEPEEYNLPLSCTIN